jgi:hypothetical protein
MNQRIRELAAQIYGSQATEQEIKFAQLIVRECAELVDGRTFLYAGNTIREHFGVEE